MFGVSRLQKLVRNICWVFKSGGLAYDLKMQADFLQGMKRELTIVREGNDGKFYWIGDEVSQIKKIAEELRDVHRSSAWVSGHLMRLDPEDRLTTRYLVDNGCMEPFEMQLSESFIRPGDTVVDVGANIGYYTLHFARQVGPTGHVFAFEPDPRNFKILQRNVRQNGYRNVTMVQKAVSSEAGMVKLYRNLENRGDHRIYASDPNRESVDVECIRLDDFFADHEGPIRFMKFDVQGAEAAAFEGMQNLLERNPEISIFTEFWPRGLTLCGYDPASFARQILSLGFKVQVIDEKTERVLPFDVQHELERLPIHYDTDVLFTNLLLERNMESYQQARDAREEASWRGEPALTARDAA